MFSKTLNRFRKLEKTTRSMVYLYWVWEFAELMIGIFFSIFVYMETQSLMALAIFNLVYFFAIFLGFVVWGYLMAQIQISMRFNYLRAFLVYIISYLLLIFLPHDFNYLLIFGLLNGIGLGMVWVGIHSYEMLYTDNKNRDFYSSMCTAGGQILRIISPFIATITFIISDKVLQVGTFDLLFWIIPFVYLLAVPVLFSLPDFVPKKITWCEIKRLTFNKKINKTRTYFFAQSWGWGIWAVIFPIIAINSLNTVVNVGILETTLAILSLLTVVSLSHHRHEGNRLQIMFYAVLAAIVSYGILFFWETSVYFYIAYSLMMIFIHPVFRVSEHVIDLHSVDISSENGNFYPPLLYRDTVLAFGRILAVLMMAGIFYFLQSESTTIRSGIVLFAVFDIFMVWAAKRMLDQGIDVPEN